MNVIKACYPTIDHNLLENCHLRHFHSHSIFSIRWCSCGDIQDDQGMDRFWSFHTLRIFECFLLHFSEFLHLFCFIFRNMPSFCILFCFIFKFFASFLLDFVPKHFLPWNISHFVKNAIPWTLNECTCWMRIMKKKKWKKVSTIFMFSVRSWHFNLLCYWNVCMQ